MPHRHSVLPDPAEPPTPSYTSSCGTCGTFYRAISACCLGRRQSRQCTSNNFTENCVVRCLCRGSGGVGPFRRLFRNKKASQGIQHSTQHTERTNKLRNIETHHHKVDVESNTGVWTLLVAYHEWWSQWWEHPRTVSLPLCESSAFAFFYLSTVMYESRLVLSLCTNYYLRYGHRRLLQ